MQQFSMMLQVCCLKCQIFLRAQNIDQMVKYYGYPCMNGRVCVFDKSTSTQTWMQGMYVLYCIVSVDYSTVRVT